ncbi:tripartite tricarboxylate transporter permease [bacterium]|nr:tripartite tricarboxylate transporter permease [candidate division CSSED10-310 bacterium]
MIVDLIILICFVILGTLAGALLSLIPSLHIYNTAGIALIIWIQAGQFIPFDMIAPFFLSLLTSFTFISAIPMTLIGAPDESATATILPNTKYLMTGRGYEAVVISGIGSLMGIIILAGLSPVMFKIVPLTHRILAPHLHWIIMAVIAYMLMSEWPKGEGIGETSIQRLLHAWGNLFAGLLTFILAGLLGLFLTSRPLIGPEAGFQNLMPVFIGLFAIPGAIQHLLSRQNIPNQFIPRTVEITSKDVAVSGLQGTIAGGLAAYLPAVTAGIGSIIAGHTVARRGDRLFIISGGVAKVLYYIGAFLLLYLITPLTPGGIGRGGLAIILKPVLNPLPRELLLMIGIVVFTACISFLFLLTASRWMISWLKRFHYHALYWSSLALLTVLVFWITGWEGFLVMLVATCIGLIPVFYHCRRSNCMAVLLLPIALNMAGHSSSVLRFFQLE